jgi:hypothetical protein
LLYDDDTDDDDKQRKGNHQPTATPHTMSSMMLSSFSSLHSKRHDGVFVGRQNKMINLIN